jgi:ATP-dependent RNA helicase DDX55/SPB4
VLLAPNEDTYVDFLAVRKVPVRQVQPDPAAADVMGAALGAVRGDLDLHEKGQRAMVSFVRAYKEHHCNYIFQLEKAHTHHTAPLSSHPMLLPPWAHHARPHPCRP